MTLHEQAILTANALRNMAIYIRENGGVPDGAELVMYDQADDLQRAASLAPTVLDSAVANFAELVLLFHSASPWDSAKMDRWHALQTPILRISDADMSELARRENRQHGFVEVTTKGLCDLARILTAARDTLSVQGERLRPAAGKDPDRS
jgi:hypothetical protein